MTRCWASTCRKASRTFDRSDRDARAVLGSSHIVKIRPGFRILFVVARGLDQDMKGIIDRQRPNHAVHALEREAVVLVPHHLKCCQFSARCFRAIPKTEMSCVKEGGAQSATCRSLGAGKMRKAARVTTPRTPSLPMKSCLRSMPVLFFMYLRKPCSTLPSAVTTSRPRIKSRVIPYRITRLPPALSRCCRR